MLGDICVVRSAKSRKPASAGPITSELLNQSPDTPDGHDGIVGDNHPPDPPPPSPPTLVEIPPSLTRAVEERLPPEAKALPPDVLEQTIETAATLSVEYLGHIPPPFVVAGWERLHPGSADRILRMTENDQAAIIRDVEDRRRRDDRFRIILASFGAALILVQFTAALVAVSLKAPWWAVAGFLGTGAGSTVYAWIQFLRMQQGSPPVPAEVPKLDHQPHQAAQSNKVQKSARTGKRTRK